MSSPTSSNAPPPAISGGVSPGPVNPAAGGSVPGAGPQGLAAPVAIQGGGVGGPAGFDQLAQLVAAQVAAQPQFAALLQQAAAAQAAAQGAAAAQAAAQQAAEAALKAVANLEARLAPVAGAVAQPALGQPAALQALLGAPVLAPPAAAAAPKDQPHQAGVSRDDSESSDSSFADMSDLIAVRQFLHERANSAVHQLAPEYQDMLSEIPPGVPGAGPAFEWKNVKPEGLRTGQKDTATMDMVHQVVDVMGAHTHALLALLANGELAPRDLACLMAQQHCYVLAIIRGFLGVSQITGGVSLPHGHPVTNAIKKMSHPTNPSTPATVMADLAMQSAALDIVLKQAKLAKASAGGGGGRNNNKQGGGGGGGSGSGGGRGGGGGGRRGGSNHGGGSRQSNNSQASSGGAPAAAAPAGRP